MAAYDVLLFDGYFCDLVITGLPEVPQLGKDLFGTGMSMHAGGTFNTARALHRLGVKFGWVCDFGNDLFSQYVLNEIRQEGLATDLFRFHDCPIRSFSLSFSFDRDRGFISYVDPVQPYDRVPYVLELRPKSLLFGSLEYGPDMPGLLEAARQIGATVYMDCQATQATLETPGLVETLAGLDVFLPNASEAMQLTGACDVEAAAQILSRIVPAVVVKMGAQGVLLHRGEQRLAVPALDVKVFDTTGAGDCFNAGFVYNHLKGKPLEACLQTGVVCGSLSTTAYGTFATPTEADLHKYL